MPHILQIIEIVLVWWVIVALFLVLNIYLGGMAVSWYQKRRKRKEAETKKETP